jgi:hypothetical protein
MQRGKLEFYQLFLWWCSLLLAPCSAVEAQHPKNVARLGFLDSSTAPGMAVLINTLREELTKLGWAEGRMKLF